MVRVDDLPYGTVFRDSGGNCVLVIRKSVDKGLLSLTGPSNEYPAMIYIDNDSIIVEEVLGILTIQQESP